MQFVSWSPDSKELLIQGNQEAIYLWDGVNGDLIQIVDGNASMTPDYLAPWSLDSRFIAFAGRRLRVRRDVNRHRFSENFLQSYEVNPRYSSTSLMTNWSPDSRHLAVSLNFVLLSQPARRG